MARKGTEEWREEEMQRNEVRLTEKKGSEGQIHHSIIFIFLKPYTIPQTKDAEKVFADEGQLVDEV